MIFKAYFPDKARPYFKSLRQIRPSSAGEKAHVLSLPFGNPVFLFSLGNHPPVNLKDFPQGVIIGQFTKPLQMELSGDFHILAIHLQPYGLKQWLHLTDASVLTNRFTDISAFDLTKTLYNRLLEVKDNERELPAVINRFFDDQRDAQITPIVQQFIDRLNEQPSLKIREFVGDLPWGGKILMRRCRAEIGLNPKQYLQVCRLFRIVHQMELKNDWMQIVSDYDYFDQSHWIKEFKQVAQLTPSHFIDKGLLPVQLLPAMTSFD